jgi:hypothetical protein
MSELRYRQCDVCARVLPTGVPFAIIAVSLQAGDVCSVECAQLWITQKLEEPQMTLPLYYDSFGGSRPPGSYAP